MGKYLKIKNRGKMKGKHRKATVPNAMAYMSGFHHKTSKGNRILTGSRRSMFSERY